MENIVDAIMQMIAEKAIAFIVPIESASVPIREFPIGAKPRNTSAYTLITLPLRPSGTESCIKLFAIARRLTIPHPTNIREANDR